jgi:hypothetical protein
MGNSFTISSTEKLSLRRLTTISFWNTNRNICGSIIVQSGATLHLNRGNLLNCNVKVMPVGHVILQNNAQVQLRNSGEWDINCMMCCLQGNYSVSSATVANPFHTIYKIKH